MNDIVKDARAIWIPILCALVHFFVLLPIHTFAAMVSWLALQVCRGCDWIAARLIEILERAER